jgi:DNA-binding transcriptional ArsR family regulator
MLDRRARILAADGRVAVTDRGRILDLLAANARATVYCLAVRMSPDQELDFDYRRRIGWALGWLRRAGLVESRRSALVDGALWSITNAGCSVLDGRCSATVFRSNQEGRCLRRAVQDLRCRQHADHTQTGTSASIIVNAIPPAFASLTRSHTALNAAAATAG